MTNEPVVPNKVRSVAEHARELPLFATELERFAAMHKAVDSLGLALKALLASTQRVNAIDSWFADAITDAMHAVVAHLEIAGACQETVEFACKNHRKKQELLIAFIREVAKNETATGYEARAKLKEWNL